MCNRRSFAVLQFQKKNLTMILWFSSCLFCIFLRVKIQQNFTDEYHVDAINVIISTSHRWKRDNLNKCISRVSWNMERKNFREIQAKRYRWPLDLVWRKRTFQNTELTHFPDSSEMIVVRSFTPLANTNAHINHIVSM